MGGNDKLTRRRLLSRVMVATCGTVTFTGVAHSSDNELTEAEKSIRIGFHATARDCGSVTFWGAPSLEGYQYHVTFDDGSSRRGEINWPYHTVSRTHRTVDTAAVLRPDGTQIAEETCTESSNKPIKQ